MAKLKSLSQKYVGERGGLLTVVENTIKMEGSKDCRH